MISMVDCLSGWAAPAAILNPAAAPGAVWAEALSGDTEWHSLAADQAGKVCRLALPAHSFPS